VSATAEQHAAARSFATLGSALVDLGRRLNGGKLIAIGRRLGKVSPRELEDDRFFTLRRPVDELRAFVDELATLVGDLRTIVDALAGVVGVEN
jgi:hypothetical protein